MLIAVSKEIAVSTQGFCDIVDITAAVREQLAASHLTEGSVTVFVSGSTAAITTVEQEPGLIQNLKELVEKIVPSDRRYHHDDRWGDDNGFAHLRASLFGPSVTIPVVGGDMRLGTWQQIVLLDFDNRPRQREIIVQFIGESV